MGTDNILRRIDAKGRWHLFIMGVCFVFLFGLLPHAYASAQGDHDTGHHHSSEGLSLAQLIKPMGIITLSLLVLTAAGRLFRKKVPKFLTRWHKYLGITTLISAFIHAILVLIAH
jgi:hypothetical protein